MKTKSVLIVAVFLLCLTGNSRTYYYCNWGWNGLYNGYFLDTFTSGNGSYRYGKKIIYNIHPNN